MAGIFPSGTEFRPGGPVLDRKISNATNVHFYGGTLEDQDHLSTHEEKTFSHPVREYLCRFGSD